MPATPPPTLQWLTRHPATPGRRLPARAELLLLFAAAAEGDSAETGGATGQILRKDVALLASHRQLAENRRHAHFKVDNRSAV
ncbi:MAG: hypothetical protein ACHQ4G_03130 [Opitutales bacterium]